MRTTHEDKVETVRDYLEELQESDLLSPQEQRRVNWTLRNRRRLRRLAAASHEEFLIESNESGVSHGILDFFDWLIENQDSILSLIEKLIALFGLFAGLSFEQALQVVENETSDPLVLGMGE